MKIADSKREEFFSLEIIIENFSTNNEKTTKSPEKRHDSHEFIISFYLIVALNGVGFLKATKGWLAVVPIIQVHKGFIILHNTVLSWIVSVIDTDGNSRFPRSFEFHYDGESQLGDLSGDNLSETTYLERSFILSRADELLPEGVLTLRCDVCFSRFRVSPSYPPGNIKNAQTSTFEDFLRVIPQRVCFKSGAETGDPNETFILFDFTSQAITSSNFHLLFMLLGCNDTYDEIFRIDSKLDGPDISEHVWIFDARPDRFLLSLDGRQDSVGARLLKASSLIRHCVEVPLKGEQENYLELPNVDSETFKVVLFFLASGTLPNSEFGDLKKVYKVSHLYEMEELQRRCAKCMVESIEPESNFEKELEGIADLYSDEYLSELLKSRRQENLERDLLRLRVDDRAYSDCYI